MILVPAATPVTKPLLFTVATPLDAEVHGEETAAVPEPVNCVVDPTHTFKDPVIPGSGFTVKAFVTVLEQEPLLLVYATVTVPEVTPVTTPPVVIVAEPVPLIIDHVPPDVGSVNAGVVELTHTAGDPPAIAEMAGIGLTVTVTVFDVIASPSLCR